MCGCDGDCLGGPQPAHRQTNEEKWERRGSGYLTAKRGRVRGPGRKGVRERPVPLGCQAGPADGERAVVRGLPEDTCAARAIGCGRAWAVVRCVSVPRARLCVCCACACSSGVCFAGSAPHEKRGGVARERPRAGSPVCVDGVGATLPGVSILVIGREGGPGAHKSQIVAASLVASEVRSAPAAPSLSRV